eukprot:Stramenopile-MAST_4_protein_4476
MSDWEVGKREIVIGEEIGRGAFGVVHKATYHRMDVVVKKIADSADGVVGQYALKLLKNEVWHLSKLRHRNIVPLIGMCEDPVMLVLAYAEHRNLKKFLENNPSVSTLEKLKILDGVANGMNFLHSNSKNVLHLDLKPENILINKEYEAWVSDFRLSTEKANMPSHDAST